MAVLGVLSVSAVIGLAGLIAVWLGFDDRNAGLLTGGAIMLGSACLAAAIAVTAREVGAARRNLADVLARLADAPRTARAAQPASTLASPRTVASDGAYAAVAAVLDQAPTTVSPVKTPPAPEPVLPESPRPSAVVDATMASPAAEAAAPPPTSTESLAPKTIAPATIAPPPPQRPFTIPPRPVSAALATQRPPSPDAPPPIDFAASRRARPSSSPPDIDTILGEIIARRDRRAREESLNPDVATVSPEKADQPGSLARGEPAPAETEPAPAPQTVAASAPELDGSTLINASVALKTPAQDAESVDDAPDVSTPSKTEAAEEAAEAPGAAETRPIVEEAAEPEPVAGAPETPEPAEQIAAEATKAAEPETALQEVEPEAQTEPAESAAPSRKMVRSFSSGPNRYTMFDDGSIEAETPTGRLTFASFDDLRRYIDERMNQRNAQGAA